MAGKKAHNEKPIYWSTTNSGVCKPFKKPAEVTSHFLVTLASKKDMQKSDIFQGYTCSLQDGSRMWHPDCDTCPLVQKER